MTDTPAPRNIDEALFILQQNPPVLVKDQDGQVGNQKTKYADLVQANEKILKRLTELGVLWKTKPTTIMIPGPNGQQDPRFVLDYRLLHVKSGTFEDGIYPLPAGANPMQNGSAITYARRYALIAVTNTVAEGMDDDGNAYAGRGMAQRASARQQQSAPAATAQRAAPAPRAERAQPAQRPAVPAPTSPAPVGGTDEPTAKQKGMLGVLFSKDLPEGLSVADREQRLGLMSEMLGRPIGSINDLTKREASGAIDAITKSLRTENPFVSMVEIYQRTTGDQTKPAPAKRARPAAPLPPTSEWDEPPAKRARPAAPPRPPVAEQTRNAVLGSPAGEDDRAPWDEQVMTESEVMAELQDNSDEWPETAQPGGTR